VVNLVSRLESLNKRFRTELIVSGETFAALGGGGDFRPLGVHSVRGHESPVALHALTDGRTP
jgi:class 3 adenylate cyclase